MVGVPGRSKGCGTCIQRRIKCDQAVPFCGNCAKSKRLCAGYKRRLGLVLSGDMALAGLASSADKPSNEGIVVHHARWKKSRSRVSPQSIAPCKATYVQITWADERPGFCPSPRRRVSTQTAMRQQFHYHYLAVYIPEDVISGLNSADHVLPSSWIVYLQDADIQLPCLELALVALTSARVGACNNDHSLVSQSHNAYVKALRQLRRDLVNPRTRLSDEVLAACMALSTYELIDRPTGPPSGLPAHLKGALAIMNLRGADSITSPLSLSLFLSLRSLAVMHSLMHNRSGYFSGPRWADKPWNCSRKSPLDKLTDIFNEVSDTLQQRDKLLSSTSHRQLPDALRCVIDSLLNVDSRLRAWYSGFQASASGPLYWAELSTVDNITDDEVLGKLFPTCYRFPCYFISHTVTTYWNATLMVHLHLTAMYSTLAKMTSPQALGENGDEAIHTSALLQCRQHDEQWREAANDLCRSAECFFQDKMGGLGAIHMFPLLYGAKLSLERVPGVPSSRRHVDWIGDCVNRLLTRYHFPLKNILHDYENWKQK